MQEIRLNLVPHGVPPTVYFSQFDTKQDFKILLYSGDDGDYEIPSTAVVYLDGRKPDKNVYHYSSSSNSDILSFSGNTVTVHLSDQMTVVPGLTIAEIQIAVTEVTIGSLNFYIKVEPSPLDGVSEDQLSDSVISGVNAVIDQVKKIAQETDLGKYADDCKTYATAASNSETNAKTSEERAASSASNASSSETNAATSERNAKASEETATTAAKDAVDAKNTLTNDIATANDLHTTLTTDISNANKTIDSAESANTDLNDTINDGTALKNDLTSQNSTATSNIDELTRQNAQARASLAGAIYSVSVNGTALTPDASKNVDVKVPTKNSELTNDSGYLKASDIVGKADTASLSKVATSGSYNDLKDKPTNGDLAKETYRKVLSSNGWTGDDLPYKYPIKSLDLTPPDTATLLLSLDSENASQAAFQAFLDSYIQGSGTNTYLYAWGGKPAVDIPVIITIIGSM